VRSARRLTRALALVAVPLVVFGCFYAAPMVYMLRNTLNRFDPTTGVVSAVTLTNFTAFLGDGYYLSVLWQTIRISLIVTAVCAALAYPIAYYLARVARGSRTWVVLILLLPLVTSPVVVSYGWLVLLGNTGLVNSTLTRLGIVSQPLRLIYSQTGIVIGLVQVLLSFMVLSLTAALQKVDLGVVRAARSLGASPRQAFWRVVFPLSLPGLRTGCLLVFSLSMSSYAVPALIGGPQEKLVSFLIYQQATAILNWPFAATMSVILVAATTGTLGLVSAGGQLRAALHTRRLRTSTPERPALALGAR
jgi:putative spermidine/putrescine transport system permease protein